VRTTKPESIEHSLIVRLPLPCPSSGLLNSSTILRPSSVKSLPSPLLRHDSPLTHTAHSPAHHTTATTHIDTSAPTPRESYTAPPRSSSTHTRQLPTPIKTQHPHDHYARPHCSLLSAFVYASHPTARPVTSPHTRNAFPLKNAPKRTRNATKTRFHIPKPSNATHLLIYLRLLSTFSLHECLPQSVSALSVRQCAFYFFGGAVRGRPEIGPQLALDSEFAGLLRPAAASQRR